MIMAFPYIVFVIAVVTIFGGGLKNLILAMTLISWITMQELLVLW